MYACMVYGFNLYVLAPGEAANANVGIPIGPELMVNEGYSGFPGTPRFVQLNLF